MSMWDDIELEPFGEVLRRQVPSVPGEAIQMKVFSSKLPKSCGSPWKGAYSRHGIWYKFYQGTKEDYEKLVALSWEQDGYLLSYDDYSRCEKLYDKVFLFVAKNLRGDVMGGCLSLVRKSIVQLGPYFVQEDYRHSGIGSQLFGLSMMHFDGHEFIFNSMHHLHPTLARFGLQLQFGRRIVHYTLDRPGGFPQLLSDEKLTIRKAEELTPAERMKLSVYLEDVTGQQPFALLPGDSLSLVAFDKTNGKCVGYGRRSETAGGEVRPLLVAPLYGNDRRVTESLLRGLLEQFYNPKEDFDFDPDPLAIYRRQVHFFIPEQNQEMLPLLEKLSAGTNNIQNHRLQYQTSSSGLLPGARLNRIFACDNPHLFVI